ncbi:response regulator [Nafulsella turpanensis]|uniref:response regulator n=1 Tax=Nafulsella turpanensis TaxID=1265690 RepID=UPI00034B0449|nr:response regulator [Nafulsella turpanensis]
MNKIKQIFFIDDDEINNFILKEIFESQDNDIKVTFFTEAAKALVYVEALVQGSASPMPDIIFLDVKMPEMDGFDFLDAFEQKGLNEKFRVPIFMLTSSVNQRDISRAATYRAVKELITKPLTFEKLQELEDKYY